MPLSRRHVFLLGDTDAGGSGNGFGEPTPSALYRSRTAHQVTRAVSRCNFRAGQPSVQAWTYAAYVAMLATMAPEMRERVLARFPAEGVRADDQINAYIDDVNPARFAVSAHRHFLRSEDGRA